jgi:hypothetical protein
MSQLILKIMEYSIYATLSAALTGCSAVMPRVPMTAFDNEHVLYLSYVEQVPIGMPAVPVVSNSISTASAIDVITEIAPAIIKAQAESAGKVTTRSIEIYVGNSNNLSEAGLEAILRAFNESITSR